MVVCKKDSLWGQTNTTDVRVSERGVAYKKDSLSRGQIKKTEVTVSERGIAYNKRHTVGANKEDRSNSIRESSLQ